MPPVRTVANGRTGTSEGSRAELSLLGQLRAPKEDSRACREFWLGLTILSVVCEIDLEAGEKKGRKEEKEGEEKRRSSEPVYHNVMQKKNSAMV